MSEYRSHLVYIYCDAGGISGMSSDDVLEIMSDCSIKELSFGSGSTMVYSSVITCLSGPACKHSVTAPSV